ncbi:MAG: hypothetical protein A2Y10_10300 [Planctomycetes bacterium GWF2_41_51]|nr:MAG: hypothetical protein A2Y10_10300 [Planctomycetes bacterium GWF2_41_51]HBG27668.1 hypothetical protein [Phycisphaerales bacterium]
MKEIYKMKNLSILILVILFAAVTQGSKILLESNFNNMDGWNQEYGGQWQIKDQTCQGKTRSIWAGNKTWENYSFSLKARCIEGDEEGQIWFSVRYTNEWNRYAIAIRGGLLDEVALFRYEDADPPTPRFLCPLNIPLGFDFKSNTWYNIKAEVTGPRIKIWVGDVEKPQIDYTDSNPILNGAVAIGGNYYACQFDDVKVQEIQGSFNIDNVNFANSAIKYNFGSSNTRINGFINSDGSVYDKSLGFGWNKDMRSAVRKRNLSSIPELDTLITVAHAMTDATFTIDTPNRDYCVTAVGYDPQYDTYFKIFANDTCLANIPLKKGTPLFAADKVRVDNGKIEIKVVKPASEPAVSLAYVVIEPWHDVADRESQRIKPVTIQTDSSDINEKLRIAQRQQYQPLNIKDTIKQGRTQISLNGNWLFMPSQYLDETAQPQLPQYSDINWHIIDVPEFWNQIAWWTMEVAGYGLRGQAMAYRYDEVRRTEKYTFDYAQTNSAWYRQWITIPETIKGRRVIINFQASASVTSVYINGRHISNHIGMFTPFEFDITDYIIYDKPNLIAVHVSSGARKMAESDMAESDKVAGIAITMVVTDEMLNSLPKGIYSSQSTSPDYTIYRKIQRPAGLWQPVSLFVTNSTVIENVFFKPEINGANIDVTLKNSGNTKFDGAIKVNVVDITASRQISVDVNQSQTLTFHIDVDNPKLWTPETPNLYKLNVALIKNSKQIDNYSCNVGFRTFKVKNGIYYFNERPHWLGGANMPPHGLRPNDKKLANKFMKLMHDGHQMITRSTGSPLTPVWADAADKQGVAVSLEGTWPWMGLYDHPMPEGILMEAWQNEMIDLVKQLRNHPSIIMWTIGNEFNYHPQFHKDAENPEQIYLKKMHILSEFVKKLRQLDPTRPICLWSNYTREKDLYERILKPGNIDDGDITDPHLYLGWYMPSVFQDSRYNGGYLPEYTGQAIMSQEASTGYPNNDNGSPERIYIQLYTPQSWIGDDAYEHRDPSVFLDYNALISKEWMEDVRRTRRTAGWVAFSNVCWFKYASFADHIQPYPTYYEMKKALQPVLVSLDQRDRHYYQGNNFSGKIVVVNDDINGSNFENLKCTIDLINRNKEKVFSTSILIGNCPYYGKTVNDFYFTIPDNLTDTRDNFKLRLTLNSGRKQLSRNNYTLLIASKDWGCPKANIKNIGILKANNIVKKYLHNLGATDITIDDIKKQQPVIWANVRIPDITSCESQKLLDYVANGGTLILLETQNANTILPDGIVKEIFKDNVEFANIELPQHPLFDGFESQDLRWLNGSGTSLYAAGSSYILCKNAPCIKLTEHIPYGYGSKDTITCPMFIVDHGKGRILVSEIRTSACDTDPLAGKILSNIINWANK